MKSITLSTTVFVAIMGMNAPARADNPLLVQQRLSTGECTGCHFSYTSASDIDLSQADLQGATLGHGNLNPANLTSTNLYLTNEWQIDQRKNAFISAPRATKPLSIIDFPDQTQNISSPSEQQEIYPSGTSTHGKAETTFQSDPLITSSSFPYQQPLISQATTSQPVSDVVPLPISTKAADLAQLDPASPNESDSPDEATPTDTPETATKTPVFSPLANQQFQQPTAIHLPNGVVALSFTNRLFFLPGTTAANGTSAYPNFGVTWGITDRTELDLTLQVVDTGAPERLGPFGVVRRVNNRELTLSVKQRLWNNPDDTLAFSGSFSLAVPLTKRTFEFTGGIQQEDKSLIPALQLPFTATVNDRWQFTLSPTIAFFPDSNAVFIPRAPIANPGSFGTTLGLSGAISYQVHPRITLWGDAFVPLTGNNSFNRDTGLPAKSIAYNAGLRYFLNPSLGLDLFASNTFGSKGPLALTADRDLTAFGVRLIALPSLLASNRRYADSFNRDQDGEDSPITTDGLAFFDGGTVPSQRFLFHLQGGGQGILTALRYGVTKDFELSTYLDYVFGEVDESEQGFAVKLRLLNQDEGAPLTGSAAVTVGLTNNIFDNFDNNNRNGLFRQGAAKDFPLIFRTDSPEGRRFIVTLSLPLHYKVNDKLAFWFTPTAGFVQRDGIELGGFNVGGSVEVIRDLSLVGELGANFFGEGNAFIGNTLADRIPWNVAVRWNPRSILGGDESGGNNPSVEFFVTNRVGSSTWNQLRVRDQNEITVGAGLSIPF